MILNISVEAWLINIVINIFLYDVGFSHRPNKADRQVEKTMGHGFMEVKNWPVRTVWFLHIVFFVLCVSRLNYLGVTL